MFAWNFNGVVLTALAWCAVAAAATIPVAAAEIDPLAPAGISVGMKGAKAAEELLVNGYTAASNHYRAAVGAGYIFVQFTTARSRLTTDPIEWISYRRDRVDVDHVPDDLVRRLTERIGTPHKCSLLTEASAQCAWKEPPKAPGVAEIELSFNRGQVLTLTLSGVRK